MDIKEILLQVVGLLILFLGMPLTQYFKNKLNLKDKVAVLLTGLVAVVLALVQLLVSGELTFDQFTLENFAGVFSIVFTISQFWYKLLIKKEEESAG